jgi:hypothetical protein
MKQPLFRALGIVSSFILVSVLPAHAGGHRHGDAKSSHDQGGRNSSANTSTHIGTDAGSGRGERVFFTPPPTPAGREHPGKVHVDRNPAADRVAVDRSFNGSILDTGLPKSKK